MWLKTICNMRDSYLIYELQVKSEFVNMDGIIVRHRVFFQFEIR
jgi:hypothetical protein